MASMTLAMSCSKATDRKASPVGSGRSKAADLVAEYLATDKCEDRLRYVLSPERNAGAIREAYSNRASCTAPVASIDDRGCTVIPARSSCEISVSLETGPPFPVFVVDTPDGLRIDWRASTAYNPIPLLAFRSTHQGSAVFRLLAKLSDYYNFEFSGTDKTELSIALREWPSGERVHGFGPRDRADIARLSALLADGKEHRVMVRLAYGTSSESPSVARLEFIQEDWSQSDAEFAPAAH